MINFMMRNMWTFLMSLLIVMAFVFACVYYFDKKYPFQPEKHMASNKHASDIVQNA